MDSFVLEIGSYRVATRRGTSRRLIVSLAGLDNHDHRPGVAPSAMLRAWRGTLARVFADDHVVFVQDARGSWFNDSDGFADLVACIEGQIVDAAIEQTLAIGFSMGATGAFVLDAILRFNRVVALAPQALIGSAVCPWDRRYVDAWQHIGPLRHARIAPMLRKDGRYSILIPVDIVEDVRHAAELARYGNHVAIFSTRCGEHDIFGEVRRKGLQDALLRALIAGEEDLGAFGYRRMTHEALATLDRILIGGVDAAPLPDVADFAQAHPALLPTGLFQALYDAKIARAISLTEAPTKAFPAHGRQICRPHDLRRYAAEGWFAFDQGFTWSEGVHHFIRLHVIDFAEWADVRVRLFFLPFVNARHPRQRVSFAVNGRLVEETTVLHGTPTATRLEIVLSLGEPLVEIHIATPDCMSPDRLGLGSDPRPIALSFNHMVLEAV